MLRQASGFTRAASARGLSRQWTVKNGSRRWNSTHESGPAAASSKLPLAFGVLILAGSGLYLAKRPAVFLDAAPTTTTTLAIAPQAVHGSDLPRIEQVSSEDDISIASPVKVLDFKAANEKIREQVTSFVFDSKDGATGRIDVVRVSSNAPVEDEWSVGVGNGVGGSKTVFAGVYDGHAGWATSAVLRKALIPYVSSSLGALDSSSNGDAVDLAIKSAFSRLDDRIMGNAQKAVEAGHEPGSGEVISAIAPAVAGSCALLSIYDVQSSVLRTAVTGDSRAVLGSWSSEAGKFSAEALSKDQTGFNKDEVDRLDAAHPGEKEDILNAKSGRLLGLAVTRAFGDHRWKWTNEFVKSVQSGFFGYPGRPNSKSPPYLTASPEVTTRTVTTDDFAILASDGLWDVMSNDDAVACVSRWLAAKRAGKPEAVTEAPSKFNVDKDGWATWKATPEDFAIEDLDSAAVCLVKNALGGRRRTMFCGAMTAYSPVSRYVRDDMTVQVIFFKDPYSSGKN